MSSSPRTTTTTTTEKRKNSESMPSDDVNKKQKTMVKYQIIYFQVDPDEMSYFQGRFVGDLFDSELQAVQDFAKSCIENGDMDRIDDEEEREKLFNKFTTACEFESYLENFGEDNELLVYFTFNEFEI